LAVSLHVSFTHKANSQAKDMILAAAKISGAKELLTEDINRNQDYGGICATNPFI